MLFILILTKSIQIWASYFGTWNLNRTIGWGWNPMMIFFQYLENPYLLFTFGYGLVYYFGRSVRYYLGLLHLVVILLSLLILNPESIHFTLIIISWILFLLNLFLSKKTII